MTAFPIILGLSLGAIGAISYCIIKEIRKGDIIQRWRLYKAGWRYYKK